ncbi:MAG: helix-hairpin-helix domain-containing protein [Deltaproteobacteria bacterium]|nr:helix-hairpin-helix domain-containing protein [Deltaproteobacteria bacterium]
MRDMKSVISWLFLITAIGLLLLSAGTAYAQHEGGLGIKKVPLNIANEEQLMRIEGMTEELAEAIVEYRETKGYFEKPEDLLKVPGMTKEVYEKLNPQVGSEGDIYCVPREGAEEEEEEPLLSPSKC